MLQQRRQQGLAVSADLMSVALRDGLKIRMCRLRARRLERSVPVLRSTWSRGLHLLCAAAAACCMPDQSQSAAAVVRLLHTASGCGTQAAAASAC